MKRLLPLLALVLGVTACGFSSTARSPGVLEQAIEQNPLTLDPARWSDVASGRIVSLVSSPLVRTDESMNVTGDLAERWEVDPSGKVYIFHLNPKAKFTNGRQVTAGDVRYSLDRVMDPKTRALRTWTLEPVAGASERLAGKAATVTGITAVDPSTVRIELKEAFAPFLQMMSMPVAGVVPKESVEALGEKFARSPVGCGPFKVVSWINDSSVELAANSAYHLGAPKLKGIRFRIIREPLTRSSEFQLGNLDVIAIPPSERVFYTSNATWGKRILQRAGLNVYYLGLNCEKAPTSDVRVRRAIAMAIDKAAILQSVRKGQGVEAAGPIPTELPGHDPAYKGIPYDPEGAKKLLADAGVGNGFELELAQGDNKDNLEVTQILASFLARVGIRVKLATFEWQTFKSRVNDGLAQAFYLSWWADYADAENFLYPLFHSSQSGAGGNGPRYKSKKVDALLDQARRTADFDSRIQLYSDIEKQVTEDASRVFLFHKLDIIVTQPWTSGIQLYPVFNANRYLDVAIDDKAIGQGDESASAGAATTQ
ncbi:MAG: ABC transporter substrate-binding protein [Candidatus Wallbacteria bacterium]|nr:ABC transporter substrate-binding protein [Candidatus Wallbacteria bacterium]